MGNDSGLIVFSLFIGSINQALAKLTTLTAQLGPQKPHHVCWDGWVEPAKPLGFMFCCLFWGGRLLFVCLFVCLLVCLIVCLFVCLFVWVWFGLVWFGLVCLFVCLKYYPTNHLVIRFWKARNPTTPTGATLCDREAYLCSLAKYGDTIVTIHFQGQIYGPGWDHKCSLLWDQLMFFQAFGTQQNAEVKTISEHNYLEIEGISILACKSVKEHKKRWTNSGLQEQDGILTSSSRWSVIFYLKSCSLTRSKHLEFPCSMDLPLLWAVFSYHRGMLHTSPI